MLITAIWHQAKKYFSINSKNAFHIFSVPNREQTNQQPLLQQTSRWCEEVGFGIWLSNITEKFQIPPLRSESRFKEMLNWEKFGSHSPSIRTKDFKDRINLFQSVSLRYCIELQSCIIETNFYDSSIPRIPFQSRTGKIAQTLFWLVLNKDEYPKNFEVVCVWSCQFIFA